MLLTINQFIANKLNNDAPSSVPSTVPSFNDRDGGTNDNCKDAIKVSSAGDNRLSNVLPLPVDRRPCAEFQPFDSSSSQCKDKIVLFSTVDTIETDWLQRKQTVRSSPIELELFNFNNIRSRTTIELRSW